MKFERPKRKPRPPLIVGLMVFLLIMETIASFVNTGYNLALIIIMDKKALNVADLTSMVLPSSVSIIGWIIVSVILWNRLQDLQRQIRENANYPVIDAGVDEKFSGKVVSGSGSSDEIKPQ